MQTLKPSKPQIFSGYASVHFWDYNIMFHLEWTLVVGASAA